MFASGINKSSRKFAPKIQPRGRNVRAGSTSSAGGPRPSTAPRPSPSPARAGQESESDSELLPVLRASISPVLKRSQASKQPQKVPEKQASHSPVLQRTALPNHTPPVAPTAPVVPIAPVVSIGSRRSSASSASAAVPEAPVAPIAPVAPVASFAPIAPMAHVAPPPESIADASQSAPDVVETRNDKAAPTNGDENAEVQLMEELLQKQAAEEAAKARAAKKNGYPVVATREAAEASTDVPEVTTEGGEPMDGVEGEAPKAEMTKKKRGRPRKRERTPDDAENIEIATNIMKMGDLCKELKSGKKSQRYEQLAKIDWSREKKTKTKDAREADENTEPEETVDQRLERLAAENASNRPQARAAPQMRLVNGKMILDTESLQVDLRQAAADTTAPREIVQESNLTRFVNSATYSKREKTERWTDEESLRFFNALGMFGTDFEMIAKLFPGRSRRQIKSKFTKEERLDAGKIARALRTRSTVDLDHYGQVCQAKFENSKDDLEAKLEKLREQAREDERREQEMKEEAARQRAEAGNNITKKEDNDDANVKGRGRGRRVQPAAGGGEEIIISELP